MDKKRFPREGATNDDGPPVEDGPPTDDTEGHRRPSGDQALGRTGPGTGGDAYPRRPSSGGELIDDSDVEGHGLPGTGGDALVRRPSSGGELIDETEAERR